MSGICAVLRKEDSGQIPRALASLTAGLALDPSERIARESVEGAGLGLAARFAGQQIYSDTEITLACDVDLLNEEELTESVSSTKKHLPEAKTAALLATLYERFGTGFIEKLRGAFSVILFDRRQRRLLAAIDGFGIKRLAYYRDEKVVYVASRVDALARVGDIDTEINPPAIANVLNFSANMAPETIFKNVRRLIPGAMLVVSDGNLRIEKYWDMRYGTGTDSSESRLSRELEQVVERSVALHCKHAPPARLGAFLSGGTDSSTVVGMMARAAQGPVKAFSIGFQEQPFNEMEYAELAAKTFNAEHHTYYVGPQDCFEALPQMIRSFDEPYGNSSAIATYFCARLAAQNGVKTLLAGDGGDELFGGNERYAIDQVFEVYHRIPRLVRQGMIEPVLGVSPVNIGLARRARGYVRRANMAGVERMLSYQFLYTHPLQKVFDGDFLRALGNYAVADIPAGHYSRAAAQEHLDRLLYVDVKITLADNDLPKVTCMSELAGIQTRFPFLERSVAEFSGRIPAGLKVKGFKKRYLFKRAFRELLPREILQKKKHGFGIPVAGWLRSDPRMRELLHDTLLSARAFNRGYFQRDFITDLFRSHEDEGSSTYYGDTLWTFLALELWHRKVLDERVAQVTT